MAPRTTWLQPTQVQVLSEASFHKRCPRCDAWCPSWSRSCSACGWCYASSIGEPPPREFVRPSEEQSLQKKRARAPTPSERHAKALARQACAKAAREEGVTLLGEEDPHVKKGKERKPLDEAQSARLLDALFR